VEQLDLVLASLNVALLDTVDTHINRCASFHANVLYRRFVRPSASHRELVSVGRVAVFALATLGVAVAARIASIESAWRFFIALGAGLGLPSMLRWLWWRVNAWTEIVGMTVAVAAALVLYPLFPGVRDEYLLVAIVAISMSAALAATFLTPPVPRDRLQAFVSRVRPPGLWADLPDAAPRAAAIWLATGWLAGNIGVFSLMFGVGHVLLGRPARGALLSAAGALALALTWRAMTRSAAAVPNLQSHGAAAGADMDPDG